MLPESRPDEDADWEGGLNTDGGLYNEELYKRSSTARLRCTLTHINIARLRRSAIRLSNILPFKQISIPIKYTATKADTPQLQKKTVQVDKNSSPKQSNAAWRGVDKTER